MATTSTSTKLIVQHYFNSVNAAAKAICVQPFGGADNL